jgi:multiple sugar transport system permease protein
MSVWASVGYPIILFIAGIQGIPRMYPEAARIDGANGWQILLKITLPLLKPTITFVLITSVIGSMQVFTQVYIMVSSQYTMALGGPAGSTLVSVLYIYVKSFLNWQMGYASALSFILFLIIAAFTLLQFRVLRMKWKY